MPCGWGCGAELTATEIREHFTSCPNRAAPVAANLKSKVQAIADSIPGLQVGLKPKEEDGW